MRGAVLVVALILAVAAPAEAKQSRFKTGLKKAAVVSLMPLRAICQGTSLLLEGAATALYCADESVVELDHMLFRKQEELRDSYSGWDNPAGASSLGPEA